MKNDNISKELKKDKYQGILDALVNVSSYCTSKVNKPGFINTTAVELFPNIPRSQSIRKVMSAIDKFYDLGLVANNGNVIEVKETASEYASER